MQKGIMLSLALIVVSVIISVYFYDRMPDMVASHWNSAGDVDAYMPRFWGLFLMPIVSLGCLLLFVFLPRIDPLGRNVRKFQIYYDGFIIMLIAFLFYLQLLVVLWGLGKTFNMTKMMVPALGLLFYYVGILVENSKRNWFIGIRTPWTLSSDKVWEKTHRLGGKLFKVSGALAFFGLFFQKHAIWFVLVPVIFTAVFTLIYSYVVYSGLFGKNSKLFK